MEEVECWTVNLRFLCGCTVFFCQIVVDFNCHIFGNINMVEEFKDCFCLFNLDTEKLPVGIDPLWGESCVQCFLYFATIAFLYSTSELTFKWHRDSCRI